MKKGRYKIFGLAALASVMLIGGTWAAWTQEEKARNEFMLGEYDTKLEEIFTPPENWVPGQEQEKVVKVTNPGDVPVMTKVVISQDWIRRETVYAATLSEAGDVLEVPVSPAEGEAFPLTFVGQDGIEEYAAIPKFNRNSVVLWENGKSSKDSLGLGLEIVNNVDAAGGKWILMNEEPDANGEYTLYYVGIVDAKKETPTFLESVTLNPKLESTVTEKSSVRERLKDGTVKDVTLEQVNPIYGYDSATYTMNISAVTVQATQSAVEEIFGKQGDVLDDLAQKIAKSDAFKSETVKTLKFDQINGKMVYAPYRTEEGKEQGNWFMSFTDMMPGVTYQDELNIENASNRKYYLYTQVVPIAQDEVKDELLDLLQMKVVYNGNLLYEGTAKGDALETKDGMQWAVPLGLYLSGEKGKIEVELKLDPSLDVLNEKTAKYADVLTKIDWKFMVTEYHSPGGGGGNSGGGGGGSKGGGKGPGSSDGGDVLSIEDELIPLAALPATGDKMPIIPVIVTTLVSMFLMLLFAKLSKKEKAE